MHGVRVKGLNTSDQKRTIQAIYEENRQLHPELEIARIAWPKHVITEQKSYSSFILETSSPVTANRIITQGLIHEGEIKDCVRYLSEAKVTRCFNCQEYGHIARICKKSPACAECAGEHRAEECPKGPEAARKCAVCGGKHRAGAPNCEIERKEKEKAAFARIQASRQYQCTVSPPRSSPPQRDPPPPSPGSPQPHSQLNVTGWKPIIRARKGRPTQLSQAANDPSQTRIFATQTGKRKERDFTSPTPPERIIRSQSQPPSESRNSYGALDSFSDMDADQE